jgi:hypothetical protein
MPTQGAVVACGFLRAARAFFAIEAPAQPSRTVAGLEPEQFVMKAYVIAAQTQRHQSTLGRAHET